MIRCLGFAVAVAFASAAQAQSARDAEPVASEAAGSVPVLRPGGAAEEPGEGEPRAPAREAGEANGEAMVDGEEDANIDEEEAKEEVQDWRFVGAFSVHGSLLSSVAGRSTLDLTYGAALRFGARHDADRLSLVVDYSGWQSLEDRSVITFATLNIAAEYTRTFFSDAVSMSLAAGPSILLTDTLLDDAGSVGLFVEFRPAGFRWRSKNIVIGVDPLSFTVVAPVLGALPLVRVQYRTTVTLEFHP